MKFALAKREITPREPVFMAGFGARHHQSEGVMDPLYVKALLLSTEQGDSLILTFDVIGSDRSFVNGIRNALHDKFGLSETNILFNFSHTHASIRLTGDDPQSRRGDYSIGQHDWQEDARNLDFSKDVALFNLVKELIVDMVDTCYQELQSGELFLAIGETKIGLGRRKLTPQGIVWAPAYDEKIDRDLVVFKIVDASGEVKGILFSCACHPTSMGSDNYLLSAEYPGQACHQLEQAYPSSIAMFMQGCSAEIKPLRVADGDRYTVADESLMRKIGDELAEEVQRMLSNDSFRMIQGPIHSAYQPMEIRAGERDDAYINELLSGAKGEYYVRAAKRLLNAEERNAIHTLLPFSVQVWRLSTDVFIVAMESEVPSAYALSIREAYPDAAVIVLGYSNGVYSYIPTRRILQEGGYEANHSFTVGFNSRYIPETEDEIMSTIDHLIGQVSQR